MTGTAEHAHQYYPLNELIERITEAVKSDSALPPDIDGEAQLATSVRDAATEKPTPVSPVPELARVISGKTSRFADNVLKVRTLKLDLMDVDPTFGLSLHSEESNGLDRILIEPIGLDGRFRTKRQDFAVVANKGAWVDCATFTLERRFLGYGQIFYWTCASTATNSNSHFEALTVGQRSWMANRSTELRLRLGGPSQETSAECLLLARRDILRCRTNSVAIGAKRTLPSSHHAAELYGYTP